MLETLMMTGSLAILGYAFYMSSSMFWTERSGGGAFRFLYALVSAFIIATYVIFSFVLFSFVANIFSTGELFNLVNSVLGILLLSGSALVSALMKYQLSAVASLPVPAEAPAAGKRHAAGSKTHGKNVRSLLKEVTSLKKELSEARALNKLSVKRELKMIELKKRIAQLEKGSK